LLSSLDNFAAFITAVLQTAGKYIPGAEYTIEVRDVARKKKRNRQGLKYEIAGLSFFALAVLVMISLADVAAGALGQFFARLFRVSLGWGAYFIPFCLILLGILFLQREKRFFSSRLTGTLLLLLVLLTLFHLPYPKTEIWSYAWAGEGGGLLGALFALVFLTLFGLVGSYIVLLTLALIASLLITNLSLVNLSRGIFGKLKEGGRIIHRCCANTFALQEDDLQQERTEEETIVPIMVCNDMEPEPAKELEKVPEEDVKEYPAPVIPPPVQPIRTVLNYQLPPLHILRRNQSQRDSRWQKNVTENIKLLEETLAEFNVKARVVEVSKGPAITRYELQLAPGTKVSRVVSLADDISLHLAATDIRIEAPIPGKAAVGIEVPNKEITPVYLREVVDTPAFKESTSPLTFALGKDIAGEPVIADLGKMPHLLIAGATGAGKSVYLNALLASFLFRVKPDEVKFILIDPKRVELSVYNDLPHLLAPVVVDPQRAAATLCWLVQEMENRYNLFAQRGVRNIGRYNRSLVGSEEEDLFLPYIVVIIDELADLMFVAPSEVEDAICRLAQMARAAGIHLVIATQRPSVDVITGLIKANIPSRISFAVSSQTDSRTILDMGGAEKLLGKGDMLFLPVGSAKPYRIQGAFISDKEVEKLVYFWRQQAEPEYREEVLAAELATKDKATVKDGEDELFSQALELVVEQKQASASMLQRRFRIGYTRAARLIDLMEEKGYVGPSEGSKPRQVLISRERLQRLTESGESGRLTSGEKGLKL
jgi:S-DNA-T family DNA segregation ATPase FtsK/SpoIIIE